MPDFIAYQQREERPTPREDGKVALSPARWAALVAWYKAAPHLADFDPVEIEVVEPIDVRGVLFLPAVYLAA